MEIVEFDDFVKFTAHLRDLVAKADHAPEIQAAIIKKLVHRIEVTPNGFEIDFHVGKNRIRREVGGAPDRGAIAELGASEGEKKERSASGYPGSRPLKKYLKDSGSKTLTFGGATFF